MSARAAYCHIMFVNIRKNINSSLISGTHYNTITNYLFCSTFTAPNNEPKTMSADDFINSIHQLIKWLYANSITSLCYRMPRHADEVHP